MPTPSHKSATSPPPCKRIAYGADPNQFGELHLPQGPGPHPAVIFIHGGYWRAVYDLTHAGDLCEAICKSGYAVWSLEYRRVGQPGGGYPGTLEDIRSGAKHITKIPGIDLTRVAVAGHSAGGHLALWLAAQNALELRGVAALAAVTDLRRAHALRLGAGAVEAFIGCAPTECADRYSAASPADLLPIKVPQRLLHGAADDIVPIELSESFAKASANAQLTAFPGAGHFELINPRSKEWPQVLCQITALLTPR